MERLTSISGATRPKRLDALTGLRFVAAAMIVVHHSRGSLGVPREFLHGFALNQGVSFFFVLSGFILTFVYPALPSAREHIRFFVARFARVWPAHLFAFLLVVALGMHLKSGGAAANPTAAITVANLSMTQAWYPATASFFSYNAVSWSISTEFFFYLAFPLLLVNLERTWLWKAILCAGLLVGMVSLCSWLKLPAYAQAAPFELNRAGILYIGPVARLAEFFLGMLTALVWRKRVLRLSSFAATALELASLLGCAAVVMLFSHRDVIAGVTGEAWAAYLNNCGGASLFAALIFVFACQRGAISRICARPMFLLLGEISFSVYLLHQILLRWMGAHRGWVEPLGAASYLAFWVILLVTSWAVWRFAEIPARRMILCLAPAK